MLSFTQHHHNRVHCLQKHLPTGCRDGPGSFCTTNGTAWGPETGGASEWWQKLCACVFGCLCWCSWFLHFFLAVESKLFGHWQYSWRLKPLLLKHSACSHESDDEEEAPNRPVQPAHHAPAASLASWGLQRHDRWWNLDYNPRFDICWVCLRGFGYLWMKESYLWMRGHTQDRQWK